MSSDPVSAALTLAVMVGLMQVAAGVLRLGTVVDYISSPVVLGYISGAGVLIGVGQLHNITATSGPKGGMITTLEGWLASGVTQADPMSVGVAAATVLLMLLMARFTPKIPGAVAVMVAAISASIGFSLEARGLAVISDIAPVPAGLPPLTLPDPGLVMELLPAAVACTVLSLVESSAIARAVASRTGQRLSASREFFGQGMANVAAAFFGGYPISGSLSRSALNEQLGAKTRWAGVIAGVLMLLVLLVVGPIFNHTPIAALAGLLLVVAWNLIDVEKIKRTIRTRPADGAAFVVTFIAALLIPLNQAIYLGVGISLVLFLQRARMISVMEMAIGPRGRLRTMSDDELPEGFSRCPRIRILHVEGVLFFGAAGELQAALDEAAEGVSVLVVRLKRTQGIDVTTIDALEAVATAMARRGQHLVPPGVTQCRQQALPLLTGQRAALALLGRRGLTAQLRGQLVPGQGVACAENVGALEHIAQLSDVAGPGPAHQGVEAVGLDLGDLSSAGGIELGDEVPGENGDVAGSVDEPRQEERHHPDSIHEIPPEASSINLPPQRLVGGGDEANIDANRLGPADGHERLALQHPQQTGLKDEGDLGDLIEE